MLASSLLMQAITTGMAARFTAAWARHEHERISTLFQAAVTWTVGLSVPVAATLGSSPLPSYTWSRPTCRAPTSVSG